MSTIKKLAGQTAIYGASSILGRLLNYLMVPLFTKYFTTFEYGIVSEFYAYVAFFVVFLTFGMETTFFRFVNKSQDKEKTFNQIFTLVLILNGLFLFTVLIFAQNIANWMLFPEYKGFVIWFAFILVFDAVSSILMAKLRYLNQAKKFAFIQLTSIFVNIVLNLIFVLIFLPENAAFGIGFIFLANLIASVVKPVLLFKELQQYKFVWDTSSTKTLLLFAIPLVIAGFAGIINETIDRILLKRILIKDHDINFAQSQVGIYSANYKLSILITLFIQAFRYAAEPFFFAQEKNKDKSQIYSKVMNYFVIVVSLIFLVISVNLDFFKWFIPNESYWEGLKVVPILLLANAFLGIYYNQSIWYKLADKTMYGAYISIIGAVLTITLNIAFIPFFGYVGAAWATFIVYFTMMIISYFWGKKIYPIKYNIRKVGLYIITAVLLFFISKLLDFTNTALSFITHNILVILFLVLFYYLEKPSLKIFRKKI